MNKIPPLSNIYYKLDCHAFDAWHDLCHTAFVQLHESHQIWITLLFVQLQESCVVNLTLNETKQNLEKKTFTLNPWYKMFQNWDVQNIKQEFDGYLSE